MRNRFAALLLLLFVLAASSCSRTPKRTFPLVQKYTTEAGDLFYFRPRDAQFVLLEHRKALAVAPEPDIQAYSYDDRITVSQPQGDILHSRIFIEKIGAQQALALTPDGRTLAGGAANGVVTVWGIPSGNLILHLDVPSPILSLAFSRDGNWLAIGLAKPAGEPADTLWLYEIHSNGPHRGFGRTAVPALAWSPDGRWLAAGLDDGSVLLSVIFIPPDYSWPRLMPINACCFPNCQQESGSMLSSQPCRPILFFPESSNVSLLTEMQLAWRRRTPKAISEFGTRLLYPNKPGGLNGSTQHSNRTRLALKTKAKSLARVRSAGTLPWLGFDRGQPNRSLLPGKDCRINALDGVASTG